MKSTGIILIASLLTSTLLILAGSFITIDNLIQPQGNLFEGVVIFSLGIILASLIVVASNVGTTILLFKDIYKTQLDFQQKITEMYKDAASANNPKSISDIIGGIDRIHPNSGSITITDLNTGETTTTELGESQEISDFSKLIAKSIADASKKINSNAPVFKTVNKTREQLEEELAEAIKNDLFEKAQEIRDEIKRRFS